jgi:hypothetical protein
VWKPFARIPSYLRISNLHLTSDTCHSIQNANKLAGPLCVAAVDDAASERHVPTHHAHKHSFGARSRLALSQDLLELASPCDAAAERCNCYACNDFLRNSPPSRERSFATLQDTTEQAATIATFNYRCDIITVFAFAIIIEITFARFFFQSGEQSHELICTRPQFI